MTDFTFDEAAAPASFSFEDAVKTAQPSKKLSLADLNPMMSTGAAEGVVSLASGAVAMPIAGLSGMAAAFAKALGITDTEAADVVRKVQEHLTYQPRSEAGQDLAGTVAAPFEALKSVADKAGEKVSDTVNASDDAIKTIAGKDIGPRLGPALGAATTTLIQAAPMALGKVQPKVATQLRSMEAAAQANRAKIASLETPVREGIEGARAAGYVVTPSSEGAGGAVSRGIEGMAGEPKTAKLFSQKNQATTNDLIRQDVGVPEETALSSDVLSTMREKAGAAYDRLREVGELTVDGAYKHSELGPKIESRWLGARSMDPKTSYTMSAADAVDSIKQLRSEASGYYKAWKRDAQPETLKKAEARSDAAAELEALFERNLDGTIKKAAPNKMMRDTDTTQYQPSLLKDFQAARTKIAKIHDAEKALNETTGNIDASVYAKLLKDKKPLSGGSLQVAQFARQFPRLAQVTEKIGSTGPTYFDLLAAGVSKEALLVGARPIARHILATRPAQALITGSSEAPTIAGTARRVVDAQGNPAVVGAEMGAEQRRRKKRADELLRGLQ